MFEMGKILFFILFLINITYAFSQDIVISADNAIWDRKKQITILAGNVLITKGNISISSDSMKVIGKLSTLNEVIGEGDVKIIDREKNIYISGGYMKYCKPTEYFLVTNKPKLELKKEDVVITALKMEGFYKKGKFIATNSVKIIHKDTVVTASKAVYFENKQRLELTGNPQVIQGKSRLTGKKIVYYIKEGRFKVIEGVKALLMRR
jgi:lipopolysaccharide transport protein LptA